LLGDLLSSRRAGLVWAAALVLLTAAPVAAQSLPQPRTWTVTPFIHTSFGMGDPAPDDSLGLGVAVSYDWTANLGFEGEISHLFDVAGGTPDVDWSVSTFMANALYHFDTRYVTPYATFGLGLERSSQGLKDPDSLALLQDFSATEIAINFGGGVKYAINDRWQARADLRRFQANDIAPDYWRIYGGLSFRLRR
jgi:opacity protein-like surface antigen